MTDTPALLSQLAYAKHRGVSHGAVAKAIKTGRLERALVTGADGKLRIDPAIADIEWAANTNQMMQRKEPASPVAAPVGTTKTVLVKDERHAAPAPKSATPRLVVSDAVGVMELPAKKDASEGRGTIAEARAIKEHYASLREKLEYEREAALVIDAEAARRTAFNASRALRNALMTVADRLAPVVAGLDKPFDCHTAISAEIRQILEDLSAAPLGAPTPGLSDE